MKRVFEKPYIFWAIGIFFIYEILNFFISGFDNTLKLIILYASTINWIKLITSLILSIAIGIFVTINSVYVYILYKQRKECKEGVAFTTIGAIGGLATGFCPLCITGLLPLILSGFGISFSFAILPFSGIEVQAIVLFILLINFYYLKKR